MTVQESLAWYVYAVLPSAAATLPDDSEAVVPGAGLTLLPSGPPEGGLAALVSLVPRALFSDGGPDGGRGAGSAADPSWVAGCAARHHAVIARARRSAPCLPLGFGTLFGSEAAVRAWLAREAASFGAALAWLGHDEEWAVTLAGDRAVHEAWISAHDPALRAAETEAACASAGRRFLLARTLARLREAACSTDETASIAGLAAGLPALCRVVRAETPPPGALAAWSLLAGQGADMGAALAGHAAALAERGLHLRVTGPWPPYAFARAALEGGGHG
jgi:hypothetical protein